MPEGLVEPGAAEQFCCNGCRTVYAVIRGCGLDRFYRLKQSADSPAQAARTTGRKYVELDDPTFQDLYCQASADGIRSVEFYLEGVHCTACVWLVERLPRVVSGVIEARLDMRRSLVLVRWRAGEVALSKVAGALDSLGYPPHPAKDVHQRKARQTESARALINLGVATACAGNVMTLAFALYGGVFSGIEAQYSTLFRWTSMGIGLVALAWPGAQFFRGAWAALRTRTSHLDLPIAMGLLAGGVAGTINAARGKGEIYFDSLTMLVMLLLAGRWLQRRQQYWANDAVELLFSLTPSSARRIEGESIHVVPLEAIQPGDLIEVRAGDSVAADGVVDEGQSSIDQALLTGESRPVPVGPGDTAFAGTVNQGARLVVRVAAVGVETRVGKLMQLVERHSRNRAPIVQFTDRVAGYFVQGLLALGLMTLAGWLYWEPGRAVDNAVALLIVCCPCALGLATPLAITIALGRAARRGILIKGGETIEPLAGRGTMFFDKTGTLTAGQSRVLEWIGDGATRRLVAALERHSSHPIAVALAADVPSDDAPVEASDVLQTPGGGIAGTVAGRRLLVGSARLLQGNHAAISAEFEAASAAAAEKGATPVLVAVDGVCVAVALLGDPIRPDAAAAIARLRGYGWRLKVLSGDHPAVVRAVSAQIGIDADDALGGITPEEKVRHVREAAGNGPVVMIGDGVNDAAALAAADVGIAVHGGAEASLAAAHVYLDQAGLTPIVELVDASRNTMGAIYRCLAASLAYNIIAAALAITGRIGPLVAAILMPISSFTMLALAFGARTFGARR